jgi:hypothetical protein
MNILYHAYTYTIYIYIHYLLVLLVLVVVAHVGPEHVNYGYEESLRRFHVCVLGLNVCVAVLYCERESVCVYIYI